MFFEITSNSIPSMSIPNIIKLIAACWTTSWIISSSSSFLCQGSVLRMILLWISKLRKRKSLRIIVVSVLYMVLSIVKSHVLIKLAEIWISDIIVIVRSNTVFCSFFFLLEHRLSAINRNIHFLRFLFILIKNRVDFSFWFLSFISILSSLSSNTNIWNFLLLLINNSFFGIHILWFFFSLCSNTDVWLFLLLLIYNSFFDIFIFWFFSGFPFSQSILQFPCFLSLFDNSILLISFFLRFISISIFLRSHTDVWLFLLLLINNGFFDIFIFWFFSGFHFSQSIL